MGFFAGSSVLGLGFRTPHLLGWVGFGWFSVFLPVSCVRGVWFLTFCGWNGKEFFPLCSFGW